MIKIITVYNSLNPGSLLQATVLYDVIKEKYGNVEFLKTNIRHPYLSGMKLSLKLLLKLKLKDSLKQLMMASKYNKILKKYKKNKKLQDKDIYILGSDEIWNVSREKISKHEIFFGEGLNKNNCISYAPSINNSKYEDFEKKPNIKANVKSINHISVRDQYSKDIIEKTIGRDVELVCDPTMLVDVERYRKLQEKKKYDNYIFVYGSPKRFTKDVINEIVNFARENNKKIIGYYFNNEWCDEILYGSPYEFLSLIDNADYVFTNTFHGTIFSIIYNKQFVSYGNNNRKIKELLEQFGLNNDYYNSKNIEKTLNQKNDYKRVNKEIEKIRDKSLKYLYKSIESIK